jgi:hypothetical protein
MPVAHRQHLSHQSPHPSSSHTPRFSPPILLPIEPDKWHLSKCTEVTNASPHSARLTAWLTSWGPLRHTLELYTPPLYSRKSAAT